MKANTGQADPVDFLRSFPVGPMSQVGDPLRLAEQAQKRPHCGNRSVGEKGRVGAKKVDFGTGKEFEPSQKDAIRTTVASERSTSCIECFSAWFAPPGL